jgi:hypothetical protein
VYLSLGGMVEIAEDMNVLIGKATLRVWFKKCFGNGDALINFMVFPTEVI